MIMIIIMVMIMIMIMIMVKKIVKIKIKIIIMIKSSHLIYKHFGKFGKKLRKYGIVFGDYVLNCFLVES